VFGRAPVTMAYRACVTERYLPRCGSDHHVLPVPVNREPIVPVGQRCRCWRLRCRRSAPLTSRSRLGGRVA